MLQNSILESDPDVHGDSGGAPKVYSLSDKICKVAVGNIKGQMIYIFPELEILTIFAHRSYTF